ncbi:MAG: hypothetical protein AB7O28_19900 [Vicinamibacterales bacterium]
MAARQRGFSVLEAIIAMAVVTTGVVSLAGLAQHVIDTVARSRRQIAATVLADAAVAVRTAGPFAPTPTDCLQHDVAGCHEALDDAGRPAALPSFVRRWRLVAVAGAPSGTWMLSVCVVAVRDRLTTGSAPGTCVSRVVAEVAP